MGAWSDFLLAARGVVPSVRAPLPLRGVWESLYAIDAHPRDRAYGVAAPRHRRARRLDGVEGHAIAAIDGKDKGRRLKTIATMHNAPKKSVSYTHLTLPTILLV